MAFILGGNTSIYLASVGGSIPFVFDSDALQFINEWETNTTVTMPTTQRLAVNDFYRGLKGEGTPNGSNLWSLATSVNARIFPLIPLTDSTANGLAYSLDAVSNGVIKGTYTNFISADFTQNGVIASTTKFFNSGVAPNVYNINSMALSVYSRTNLAANANFTGTATVVLADTKRVGVTEITSNNYYESLKDPYSEHILHYEEARPLRLFYNDEIEFVHDGTYDIFYAYIRYLQQPQRIAIANDIATLSIEAGVTYEVYGGTSVTYNGVTYTVGETFVGVSGVPAYTEIGGPDVVVTINLPQHTHSEVVNIAVDMLLENIEQPRHATFANQVNMME